MRTVKQIFFIISFCVSCNVATIAQTYYYQTTKTFNESGYAYQCVVSAGGTLTTLYNKSNQYIGRNQTYKDGTPLGENYYNNSKIHLLEDDTWTKPQCNSIVNNAFSAAEKQRIKGQKITICMYIDPTTGKVAEVDFNFNAKKGFGTIPMTVYRKIETDLKSQIWFTPTVEGKKLNYIMRYWNHEVE